ncbi:MAG: LD-carboxypeptidase [Negativicutes bacterium]|nr:LD-carboxypeptidase [Negativicutes bacterium]
MQDLPLLKPKRLRAGSTIGVIAPASPGDPDLAASGIKWLEEQGFRVEPGRTLGQTWGYLAGTDSERAADINAMFAAPAIEGIVCLRGGYGTMRLLELLDYDAIRANPKVFVGYSDITALHISIRRRTGLVTFHGPMAAADMGKSMSDYTRDSFLRAMTVAEPLGAIVNPPLAPAPVCIAAGKAEGRLTGGNLSLIAATLGTPYEIDTRGRILCLEEVGEEPYRIDRMLTQLQLAGKLQQAAGIVFAVCADCDSVDEAPGFTLEEVLKDRLGGLKKPVLFNLCFGHTADKATLPFGVNALLASDAGSLIITETATTD